MKTELQLSSKQLGCLAQYAGNIKSISKHKSDDWELIKGHISSASAEDYKEIQSIAFRNSAKYKHMIEAFAEIADNPGASLDYYTDPIYLRYVDDVSALKETKSEGSFDAVLQLVKCLGESESSDSQGDL